MCLTGNPGSGKSIISSRVINDLDTHDVGHGYFFFKHGDVTKSAISRCLLSLACQIAKTDDLVLHSIMELQHSETWHHRDHRYICRELFAECIFNYMKLVPYYLVVDALDECQNPLEFLNWLTELPPYMGVFLTSRHTPEVERGLTSLGPVVKHYGLTTEDTRLDLDIFFSSRMSHLIAGTEENRTELKQKVLEKASLSFLWVSLIVQELEQIYSMESVERVLEQIPDQMDEYYKRMLKTVVKNKHAIKLAQSVITWTLLSMRSLSLDQLHSALKLDSGETVHNLEKSVSFITGQLIYLAPNNRIQCIHDTARSFLTEQNDYPDLTVHKQHGNSRIASICLRFLVDNLHESLQSTRLDVSECVDFVAYACEYFSDHLGNCSPDDAGLREMLTKFFNSTVLHWIEYLARARKVHCIAHTAKNLRAYISQCADPLDSVSLSNVALDSWAIDLLKLSMKFQSGLITSPSSIHNAILALCPSDSIISRTYASRKGKLLIKCPMDTTWDEGLATMYYYGVIPTTIAYGEHYLAVGLYDGTISLYYSDTMQVRPTLHHGGRQVGCLVFSNGDRYLASHDTKTIKVWCLDNYTQVFDVCADFKLFALFFPTGNATLTAITRKGCCIITWNLHGEPKEERRSLACSSHEACSQEGEPSLPCKGSISQDHATLAVSHYRRPVCLFDMKTGCSIAHCSLPSGSKHGIQGAMAFNPNPDMNVLVVSYFREGLVVYDSSSTNIRGQIPIFYVTCLAFSRDGRLLLTASIGGQLCVFQSPATKAEDFELVYRVETYEVHIRSVAFSNDSLRFAYISDSQSRVMQPAVLADEGLCGNSKERHNCIPLDPDDVNNSYWIRPGTYITAICYHPSGRIVFCGRNDGSVVYYDTTNLTQPGVLFRPSEIAAGEITFLTYCEKRNLIFLAEKERLIYIKEVAISNGNCKVVSSVALIQLGINVRAVIPNVSGTKFIIQAGILLKCGLQMGTEPLSLFPSTKTLTSI